jgi:glycosyltransferase involved in cell wall biosynthesis
LIVITVPVHNESKFLRECIKTILINAIKLKDEFCIVIAEDGSTDGTDKIARDLAHTNPKIIHIHADKKLGRGLALKNAWNQVKGEIYVYVDCDLATDMKHFPTLIKFIKNGFDLATGSRYVKGAKVLRPPLRKFSSKIYNLLVRIFFRDHIQDHQAGFKAFSDRLIRNILNKCESNDWFWDTEIIIRAIRGGYRCIEFPVEWKEKKGKRTPIKRLIKDVYIHGIELFKLKFKLSKGEF